MRFTKLRDLSSELRSLQNVKSRGTRDKNEKNMKWDVNNYNLFLNNVFLKNKFSTTNHLTTV